MMDKRTLNFVKALLDGKCAALGTNNLYLLHGGAHPPSLNALTVYALQSDGILQVINGVCKASPLARNWVKRQTLDLNHFANQHREISVTEDKVLHNLLEGPMTILSVSRNGAPPFMQAHHVQAACQISKMVERAQMRQRTTMSYDPARLGSNKGANSIGPQLSDSALDARANLEKCMKILPGDCAGVVMDICGLQKGLQLVETERKWPRRSAKLILRVGLEQLAEYFGYAHSTTGIASANSKNWIETGFRANNY